MYAGKTIEIRRKPFVRRMIMTRDLAGLAFIASAYEGRDVTIHVGPCEIKSNQSL